MKINVGLIGKGKWGSKIKNNLSQISNLKFVCGKKQEYFSKLKKNKIEWIFVATPNKTHYKIVKECLKNDVNVFCEKPLCLSYKKAKSLVDLSKKKKLKLYISDIYEYHSHKIKKLQKFNSVYRCKLVEGSDKEFIYRFLYHDLSILYKFLKKNQLSYFKINKKKKKKTFDIKFRLKQKHLINFLYDLDLKKKNHYINNIKIISKKDILIKMLNDVLNNKVNIKKNNEKALFILKILNKLKK